MLQKEFIHTNNYKTVLKWGIFAAAAAAAGDK